MITKAFHKIVPTGRDRVNVPDIITRGVDINKGSLEGKVKGLLGSIGLSAEEIKINGELADKIIAALALEGMKAEGFRFHEDDPTIKQLTEYLKGDKGYDKFKDLSGTTRDRIAEYFANKFKGDPLMENVIRLRESIMDTPYQKQGDVYGENTAVGKAVAFISGQKDNPIDGYKEFTPRKLTFVQRDIATLSRHPNVGLRVNDIINEDLPEGSKLSTAADIEQAFKSYGAQVAIRNAQYIAAKKTTSTLKNPVNASEYVAAQGNAYARANPN